MAQGFFPKATTNAQLRNPPKSRGRVLDCGACGLYKGALSPKMNFRGVGSQRILVIGGSPTDDDDQMDEILGGPQGKLMRESFKNIGINFDKDCCRINAVNCFIHRVNDKIVPPTNNQIACCRQVKVLQAITTIQPEHIVVLGEAALQSIFGVTQSKLYINKFRGRSIPDPITGAWVHVLFDPYFVVDKQYDDNLKALWDRDIKRLKEALQMGIPHIPNPTKQVTVLKEAHEVLKVLREIQEKAEYITFDYETTGLRPYAPGHKILSISVKPDYAPHQVYSFPFEYPHWDEHEYGDIKWVWMDILENPYIGKIAHNIKFEDIWSREILDTNIEGWLHDTMLGEHILDNTQGITGLKHIAWTRYGVGGYESKFKKYISSVLTQEEIDEGKKAGIHHHNKLIDMPLDDLLLYGGIDSVVTSWEYNRQTIVMQGTKLQEAYDFFHAATLVFSDIEDQGVPINTKYYEQEIIKIKQEMAELHTAIMTSREAKLFLQKTNRPLDHGSTEDLKLLLFDYLGIKAVKLTSTGNSSTDAEVLETIGLPITDNIMARRKLAKISSTYMEQYLRESYDGKLHPSILLHVARTYRSSMADPNLQNAPNRQKQAKLRVRQGIIPPKGFRLMEPDYGGIEVCGMAWYSKDKEILKYLNDTRNDMHRDQAQIIFKINPDMWEQLDPAAVDLLRFHIKGGWVFAQFYGSWFKQCAKNIWKNCANLPIGDKKGTTVAQWLNMSYTQFEDHLRKHENVFWKQFGGVRKWQESVANEYRSKGYIEMLTGFRMGGYMTRNQLYNGKIQGTAFQLLLWAMMQLHYTSIKRNWKSHVMWQIHDSVPTAVWPDEQEDVMAAYQDIMINQATKKFSWINTPLKVDFEFTKIDGTYADLAKFKEGKDTFSDLDAE